MMLIKQHSASARRASARPGSLPARRPSRVVRVRSAGEKDPSGGKCPVLSGLKELTQTRAFKSHDESIKKQTEAPQEYQKIILNGQQPKLALDQAYSGGAMVVIGEPAVAKEILTHGEADGRIIRQGADSFEKLLGSSILTEHDNERHLFLRRVILRPLKQDNIEKYLPKIEAICRELLDGAASTGGEVVGNELFKRFTFRVIVEVVMGLKMDLASLKEFEQDFAVWQDGLYTQDVVDAPNTPFGLSMRARERLLARIDKIIEGAQAKIARRAAGQETDEPTVVEQLLAGDEKGERMTPIEVQGNLLSLMFAGHDTTSSALGNMTYHLATRPDVMEKLRKEQRDLKAELGPNITPQLMRKMKYAEAVMEETMRYTSVVFSIPRSTTRDIDLGGFLVKQGWRLLFAINHMLAKDVHWAGEPPGSEFDNDKFNPDRYLQPQAPAPGAGGMYFGMGGRICPGAALAWAELKVYLAVLARDYKFTANATGGFKNEPFQKPANNLPMRVTRL